MLTIFATPKPFDGHIGTIQRNAIASWLHLHPEAEVILFGDDAGCADIAAELGVRHEPEVCRSGLGTKRLDHIFARAQEIARHNLLCYANCDIVLFDSFRKALTSVSTCMSDFLMVGRRWNTPVTERIDFASAQWQQQLTEFALRKGIQQSPSAVDYFAFTRGLYRAMPPFVVGRVYWDHWLVWKARSMAVPVVDASSDVLAVHQDHDYSYHPGGLQGVRNDAESRRNRALAGGQLHLCTIEHATHRLGNGILEPNPGCWYKPATFLVKTYLSQCWYGMLNGTAKLRHSIGLRRGGLSQLHDRMRSLLGGSQ